MKHRGIANETWVNAILIVAVVLLLALFTMPCDSHADAIEIPASACSLYIASGQLRSGQTLEVGAGRVNCPPGGFTIPSGVHVIGAWPGRNRVTGGTIFLPASPNDDALVLLRGEDDPAGNVRLEQLIVRGTNEPGTGRGFVVDCDQPGIPAHIEFVRCMAWGVGQDGFFVRHPTRSVDCVLIQECSSCVNGRHGIYVEHTAWTRLEGCVVNANAASGITVSLGGLSILEDCYADGNKGPAQMVLDRTVAAEIRGGACEGFQANVGVSVSGGRDVRIGGMTFLSSAPPTAPVGTSILGQGTQGTAVARCFHRNVAKVSSWQNSYGYSVAAQSSGTW
jgi:hypothetical protein